jgi:hypothetical protein
MTVSIERRRRAAGRWAGLACVLVLSACGTSDVVTDAGTPPPTPYDGPLEVAADPGDEEKPLAERAGAAFLALECDGTPGSGGAGDYDGGLEHVGGGPAEALEIWFDEVGWGALPETGYRTERDDGDRVLLSYDVDLRTRIAFVVADGVRDYRDDEGWGVASWAACDPAELPAEETEALGIGVWTDADGRRVPTTTIVSYDGPEHCDWQDIVFVTLGDGPDAEQLLRDVDGEFGRSWLTTTYDGAATLPPGARDTGYRRDGRQLWLDEDPRAAYLVNVDDPTDVERWPAARKPIQCA